MKLKDKLLRLWKSRRRLHLRVNISIYIHNNVNLVAPQLKTADYSPTRILLGIDKGNFELLWQVLTAVGHRAADVSLRRAPSVKQKLEANKSTFMDRLKESKQSEQVKAEHVSRNVRPKKVSFGAMQSQEHNGPTIRTYDPFTEFTLSSRLLPHTYLEAQIAPSANQELYGVSKVLKKVSAPKYDMPTNLQDKDWIVTGCICEKSQIKELANGIKYMTFKLTDLKKDVEVYSWSERVLPDWKVSLGTVVTILNPEISKRGKVRLKPIQFWLNCRERWICFIFSGPEW